VQQTNSSTPSALACHRRSALALAALRYALEKACAGRETHAAHFSIAAQDTGTGVTRFLWLDAHTGDGGVLGLVPSVQAALIVQELFTELRQWRARSERRSATTMRAAAGGSL
jgi:hypothetical protein